MSYKNRCSAKNLFCKVADLHREKGFFSNAVGLLPATSLHNEILCRYLTKLLTSSVELLFSKTPLGGCF